jgi:hypothetical protein
MKSYHPVLFSICCTPMLLSCDSEVQDVDVTARTDELVTCPSITLVASDHTRGGYDFSTGKYTDLTPGDFYFGGAAFWANNQGQRGVVGTGTCSSVKNVTTMPTSGYSRNGVKAIVGNCYVALTHNDERDNIVFRVTARTSTTVTLTWKMVASGKGGATLSATDSAKRGYDFSTRTYHDVTDGDFYFGGGAFWANNVGQRGSQDVGTCASVDSVATAPTSGYSTYGRTAIVGHCYVSQTHFEEHNYIIFRVDELTSTTVTLTWKMVDSCYGLSNSRQNVDCWLSKNSNIAQYLAWENRLGYGQTSVTTWPQWTNVQRDDLRAAFLYSSDLLANPSTWDPDPLVDPPVNLENDQDNFFPATVLSPSDAWRLYVKTVAMSLAVELRQYVSWSIVGYDGASLASLFDGRHMVKYTWKEATGLNLGMPNPQAEGYILVSNGYDPTTHATFAPVPSYVVPAPPTHALAFIRDKGLLGSTRLQTITNALDWSRRMQHFYGTQNTISFQNNWQYRGAAPVSRTIDTTVSSGHSNPYHYTAGCHGTSGFLHSVLRLLNIPVDGNVVAGHSATRFMTEGLYLSHGDDPYIGTDIYGVPPGAMLISDATYRSWFVTASSALASENLGRGTTEAMIKYLSGRLQTWYCRDPVPNSDHAHSVIMTANAFTQYPSTYTLYYLEHLPPDPSNPSLPASLWDRLAQKIASSGGCPATMLSLAYQYQAFAAVRPFSEQMDYNF